MPDRPDLDTLRQWGFDEPGSLRDILTEAVLRGDKTATTSRLEGGEWVSQVGSHEVLLDSADRPVAIIEITRSEIRPYAEIDLEVALAEGEGYRSVDDWRAIHEPYFLAEIASEGGDATPPLDPATPILVDWFRIVERLHDG